MRNIIYILICLVALVCSCNNPKQYSIVGSADDKNCKFAYYCIDCVNTNSFDSVEIKDGTFTIKGLLTAPSLGVVTTADCSWSFIVEDGEITLEKGRDAKGSPMNNAVASLNHEVEPLLSINDIEGVREKYTVFITNHKNDLAGALAVVNACEIIDPKYALSQAQLCSDQIKEIIRMVVPNNYFESEKDSEQGHTYTDIEVEYEGKVQKLSDYIGKDHYTLVDFWASWCRPCRGEIPNLQGLYDRYKDKGLNVVGVATWDKPEDTKKAVEELKITYPQIYNAQSIGSDAYGFDGIPMIMLISPDGKIVAKGLRGDDIRKVVEQSLRQL